ncbi:hypothetical protein NMG60_11020490 [Bertholletia excelsa]
MWLAGGRRPVYSSLLLLLLISLLHVWACSDCRAWAIRTIQTPAKGIAISPTTKPNKNREDLFRKHFNQRTPDLNTTTSRNGFKDSKRKVPSCPDPLHN